MGIKLIQPIGAHLLASIHSFPAILGILLCVSLDVLTHHWQTLDILEPIQLTQSASALAYFIINNLTSYISMMELGIVFLNVRAWSTNTTGFGMTTVCTNQNIGVLMWITTSAHFLKLSFISRTYPPLRRDVTLVHSTSLGLRRNVSRLAIQMCTILQ